MADFDASGGSEPVEGLSRALEEITAAEMLEAQVSPSRPDWMVTRFPVDMDEYRRMTIAAEAPQLAALAPGEVAIEDPGAAQGADAPIAELPEDAAGIDALAPT